MNIATTVGGTYLTHLILQSDRIILRIILYNKNKSQNCERKYFNSLMINTQSMLMSYNYLVPDDVPDYPVFMYKGINKKDT